MSERVKLIVLVNGAEIQTPGAVLSYDGAGAFLVGDTINGARIVQRDWVMSGEGRFELRLRCEVEAVVGSSTNTLGASSLEAFIPQQPSSQFTFGKGGKRGRR